MASVTKVFKARKRLKRLAAGKKRKNKLNNHGSTPTKEVFFGEEA